MTRRRKIYEGKAKILYEGPEPGTLIQYFKDDATAFNAQKKGTIAGKGVINNRVSEHVFTRLSHIGIPTHFIRRLNMREQLIRQVEIVPIEVIVRNVAAGTLSKRLGIEEGTPLPHTLLEYCYKDDALGDPLVAEEHIACFGWATIWIKGQFKAYKQYWPLQDRTLVMIFEKASTRTRLSFEAGMHQLGGSAIYLNTHDSQLGRPAPTRANQV